MGRYSLSPNLYDEVYTIDISDLNKWGYLKPDQILSGVLSWRHFGSKTSINIIVNTRSGIPYLELAYILSGENIRYRIDLVTVPSNLNKGEVYYFLCPFTKKRCRKLYFTGKYFLHREAAKGLYRIQTLSANQRGMAIYIQTIMHGDDSIDNISKKHYKKYYAGKPTRRYRRDRKRIYKASFF
jgi:hypothetical protein